MLSNLWWYNKQVCLINILYIWREFVDINQAFQFHVFHKLNTSISLSISFCGLAVVVFYWYIIGFYGSSTSVYCYMTDWCPHQPLNQLTTKLLLCGFEELDLQVNKFLSQKQLLFSLFNFSSIRLNCKKTHGEIIRMKSFLITLQFHQEILYENRSFILI